MSFNFDQKNKAMEFYLSKIIKGASLEEAEAKVREKLAENGFGVVTYLDVTSTLKAKINKDFRPYRILGACSPQYAYDVLTQNDKVGVMLPCNVCIQELDDKQIEIFAIDPVVAMQGINTPGLESFALEVKQKLTLVMDAL